MNSMEKNKIRFKKRVWGWAEQLEANITCISVRAMKTKWASYSTTGRLTFDKSLLKMKKELQDYVIVHELLHANIPNHGKLWKSLMRAHLGDYEKMEQKLKNILM
ncbi:MAG: M48 family metallopeptidase [Candidatus Auribacterota bacterium]|nr:M48 family metallopeptidase [Candidatus Auribacterota bacterium]